MIRDHKGHKVQRVIKAIPDRQVRKARRVRLELPAPPDRRVHKGHKVCREQLDRKDLQARRERGGLIGKAPGMQRRIT